MKKNRVKNQISNHIQHIDHLPCSKKLVKQEYLTPLGPILIISDMHQLHLLQFADTPGLDRKIDNLKKGTGAIIETGTSKPIHSVKKELSSYFSEGVMQFKTPIAPNGTPFQRKVWQQLCHIPFGKTQSYQNIATSIANPRSYRAVAQANRSNLIMIIIPCHRVIYSDGSLGGYLGKVERKQWMLEHESRIASSYTLRQHI